MLQKISSTLITREFYYLDYLNHILTDCGENGKNILRTGCPYIKCKMKDPVSLNSLRIHFMEECNKMILECNCCK